MLTLDREVERSDASGALGKYRKYVERLTEACAIGRTATVAIAWKKKSRTVLGFELFRFILKRGD